MCDIAMSVKSRSTAAREFALQYRAVYHDHMFLRMRQCIDKAEKAKSWDFMEGCYSQATEIYAVASLAYEVFNQPLMPDWMFDKLAAFLLKNYEDITDFCKKEWGLRKEIFRAGTGSHFTDPKKQPSLVPYYNRLQAQYEAEAKERERIRAKNKPRLLRKTTVRRLKAGSGGIRKASR